MSLINQMLKDLKKGGAKLAKESDEITGLLASDANKRFLPAFKIVLILAISLLLLAVVFWGGSWVLKFFDKKKPKPSTSAPLLVKKFQPVCPAGPQKAVVKNPLTSLKDVASLEDTGVLEDIQLSCDAHQTRIELKLTRRVHYEFSEDANARNLLIRLDNTVPSKSSYNFMDKNCIIQELTIQNDHADLNLGFIVLPDTQIESLQYETPTSSNLILILSHERLGAVTSQSFMEKREVPVSPIELAKKQYAAGLNLIAQNNELEAALVFEKVLEHYPQFMPARKALAVLLMQNGQNDKAARVIESGLALDPDSVDLIKLQARLLIQGNRYAAALLCLQRVSPPLSEDPSYYALMALCQQHLGHDQMAVSLYEQLISVDSNNARFWLGLGVSLEVLGRTNAAMQAYQRALTLGHLSPDLQAFLQSKLQNQSPKPY